MTKDKLPQEYLQWVQDEKKITEEAFLSFKAEGRRQKAEISLKDKDLRKKAYLRPYFLRIASAAILVLALGVSMWVKRDAIFKPKYTEEQIALSYDQTLRALALCANSLSNEMNQLDKLKQIPESIDNLKKLGTIINN